MQPERAQLCEIAHRTLGSKVSEMFSNRQTRFRVSRKLVFAALTCGILLALLEGLFRLVGIGDGSDSDQFAGFEATSPVFEREPDADGSFRLQTAVNKLEWFNPQEFDAPKPAGTKRVICLGGSTTYGRPYDDKTSFCGWLREFLPVADQTSTWEVINAGGISYGSRRVLTVMRETVAYEPDVFIVYCGHNEFLERTTWSGMSSVPSSLLHVSAFLQKHSRVFRTARNLARQQQTTESRSGELPENVEAILDSSVGLDAYTRDREWTDSVVAAYRHNIQSMIDIADRHDIALLFVVPAAQLRDCAPFKSEHTTGLTISVKDQSQSLYREAVTASQSGDDALCIHLCEELIAVDPDFAHGQYLYGLTLYKTGRFAESKNALLRARDEDICPLRATEVILTALRETTNSAKCRVLDFDKIVMRLAENEIPGADVFLDHVHPTIDVNRTLGLQLIDLMKTAGILPSGVTDQMQIQEVTQRVMNSIDTASHGQALRNLSKVLSWAGKFSEADRLAIQAMEMLPNDSEAHYQGGSAWFRAGELARAMASYQRAAELDPESAQAHFGMGLVSAESGDFSVAVQHYRRAAELKPEFLDIEFNLGRAYEMSGEFSLAKQQYAYCIELNSQFSMAYNAMGTVYGRQGDLQTAKEWFRKALRIDPQNRDATTNLETAIRSLVNEK